VLSISSRVDIALDVYPVRDRYVGVQNDGVLVTQNTLSDKFPQIPSRFVWQEERDALKKARVVRWLRNDHCGRRQRRLRGRGIAKGPEERATESLERFRLVRPRK